MTRRPARPSRFAVPALALLAIVAGCGSERLTPAPGASEPTPSSASAVPSPAATEGSPAPTSTADAQPPGEIHVALDEVVAGLDRAIWVRGAGDGSGRIFVAEQPGRIRVVRDGSLVDTPFLDITDRVTAGGERGLLGFAFPPGFPAGDAHVYVHYSGEDGATVLSEFSPTLDADVLDPGSERVILTEPQPYPNHNGGWTGFDPDGMLLLALGDGGSGGDPGNRASDLGQLLGKILRIDVTTRTDGRGYGIPADNPFVGRDGARPEILHSGLRNPFRDGFDPATGDLWIGDVGQNAWEEIDVARAGAKGLDFGWRRWEGLHCFDPPTDCDPSGVTMPVAEYGHDAGCAVIGGVVYRGAALPALQGRYLFSDNCSGTLWWIDAGDDTPQVPHLLMETGASVSAVSTGDDGEVYLTDLGGRVLELVPGA